MRLDGAGLALAIAIAVVRGCRNMACSKDHSSRGRSGRRRRTRALFLERDVVLIGIRCLMLGIRGIISVGCTSGMPVRNHYQL